MPVRIPSIIVIATGKFSAPRGMNATATVMAVSTISDAKIA